MSYPSRAKLTAIVQQVSLKREGLVADCIFPKVKTPRMFSYIDWSNDILSTKLVDDSVTCKSDVKQQDSTPFTLKEHTLADHALVQVLDECVQTCEGDSAAYNARIEAGKTRQLTNKLLAGREKRAIDLATDATKYTDNTSKAPSAGDAVVDGGLFKLAKSNFADPNYALLRYFLGLQENNKYGEFNTLVTDLATLNGLLTHPNFLGAGCMVDPMTTGDKVAALLGVKKICIANASYNDGIGTNELLKKFWPADTLLFTKSHDFVTAQDETFAFGISGYDREFQQYSWLDQNKGPQGGVTMQKISHDLTEVVLSYKAAALVQLTT